MSNKFKFDEKKGELWLDEPQPKMEDFKMIDDYDNSVMIMGTVWEKAVENWKSRLHYPVSDELKKLLKDGQVIEMGIDFWIVEKCYKGTGFHDDWKEEAVPINDIAIPLPEQTKPADLDDPEKFAEYISNVIKRNEMKSMNDLNGYYDTKRQQMKDKFRELEQSELADITKLKSEHTNKVKEAERCGVCGGSLVEIRGKYPKDARRKVCPTCVTERLEQINEISNPDYGKTYQNVEIKNNKPNE